jgi:glycosyltransferase involved in cell wall biosynthesis
MRVAIVHDWLYGGGAERVIQQLHELYPDAPIYTSYCTDEWKKRLDGKVVTGYLQYWPFNKLRRMLPVLRVFWFRNLDLTAYDLIISSSGNGEAKDLTIPEGAMYMCYCHAPTHYYWRSYDQYMKYPGFGIFNPLARLGMKLLAGPLRKEDYKAAQKPKYFIANSSFIKKEIKQFYKRDSVVVHPPVAIERFINAAIKDKKGFVTVGRQVAYKRFDLIIDACNELQIPLTVIGRGPEHKNLVKRAGPTITFKTDLTDEQMPKELAKAEAFIFAAVEDFGVAPVEAMAAGTAVIAYKDGGALDYVNKDTGSFFTEQTAQSLIEVLKTFSAKDFDTKKLQKQAASFSDDMFKAHMQSFIDSKLN